MKKPMAIRMKQALWQAPAMIVAAALIAVGVNHWRPSRLALIGDWSVKARISDEAGKSLVIPLGEAENLFGKSTAIFVDARPADQYAQGHIKGALSLPLADVTQRFTQIADRFEGKKTVITYCDGETCDLSHGLALFLQDMGVANVRVLVNGWSVWSAAGLPVETG